MIPVVWVSVRWWNRCDLTKSPILDVTNNHLKGHVLTHHPQKGHSCSQNCQVMSLPDMYTMGVNRFPQVLAEATGQSKNTPTYPWSIPHALATPQMIQEFQLINCFFDSGRFWYVPGVSWKIHFILLILRYLWNLYSKKNAHANRKWSLCSIPVGSMGLEYLPIHVSHRNSPFM